MIVIQEDDGTIVGLASNVDNASNMIDEYYGVGEFEVISFDDVRDSTIENIRVLKIYGCKFFTEYTVTVTLQHFTVNII